MDHNSHVSWWIFTLSCTSENQETWGGMVPNKVARFYGPRCITVVNGKGRFKTYNTETTIRLVTVNLRRHTFNTVLNKVSITTGLFCIWLPIRSELRNLYSTWSIVPSGDWHFWRITRTTTNCCNCKVFFKNLVRKPQQTINCESSIQNNRLSLLVSNLNYKGQTFQNTSNISSNVALFFRYKTTNLNKERLTNVFNEHSVL